MNNLYSIEVQDDIYFVFASDQSEAMKIFIEKEIVNQDDICEVIIVLICKGSEIIN